MLHLRILRIPKTDIHKTPQAWDTIKCPGNIRCASRAVFYLYFLCIYNKDVLGIPRRASRAVFHLYLICICSRDSLEQLRCASRAVLHLYFRWYFQLKCRKNPGQIFLGMSLFWGSGGWYGILEFIHLYIHSFIYTFVSMMPSGCYT